MRADLYGLLALILRDRPDAETLAKMAALQGGDSPLGRALSALAATAGETTADTVDDEFHALFIGLGNAELNPYASYYLTGFLYEKPLAKLREAMGELGIERTDEVAEPEDHIAALCEMMCGMITGAFGAPVAVGRQRVFFYEHIAPWAERFFEDLEATGTAEFYKRVAVVGRLFMRIESQAFEIAA